MLIVITYDDILYIWGINTKLLVLYKELKTKLVDIDNIVVSYNSIGILKKDNSIILITMEQWYTISYTIYESDYSKYKYEQIFLNKNDILTLTDNNKVYLLPKYDEFALTSIPVEILNNIKEVYVNINDMIAISYDNIVYAYRAIYSNIYYKQQFVNNLKSIKINY